MKDRGERWLLLPFSLGCTSRSSLAVGTPSHPKNATPARNHKVSSAIIKRSKYSNGFSIPKPNISLRLQGLIKGFKRISQIFAYRDEMEEEEAEMEIGYPTDVKHLTHIGWDGSTTITNQQVKGWENPTSLPEIISFPTITFKQFELAMAAQAQENPHPQLTSS